MKCEKCDNIIKGVINVVEYTDTYLLVCLKCEVDILINCNEEIIMNRADRERLIHIGRIEEKRKIDSFIVSEAKKWLDDAMFIDNVKKDATATFTKEERDILKQASYILLEKKNDIREFGEMHHIELYNAVENKNQ